jgi:DNA-binding GntR family transcriptional regulator
MAISVVAKKHANLSEAIYSLLKKDIVESRLMPGELLQEAFVRERYQIGHTPFREACQRLESEGLIQIVPRRGYFVAPFSNKDIRDLFELRVVVETLSVELACERSNPERLDALENNLAEFSAIKETRPPDLAQAINWNNMDFHVQIARLSSNEELENSIGRIHNKLMRIIMFTSRASPEDQLLDSIHPSIFAAIKQKKTAEARKWMLKDINVTRDWVRDFGRS